MGHRNPQLAVAAASRLRQHADLSSFKAVAVQYRSAFLFPTRHTTLSSLNCPMRKPGRLRVSFYLYTSQNRQGSIPQLMQEPSVLLQAWSVFYMMSDLALQDLRRVTHFSRPIICGKRILRLANDMRANVWITRLGDAPNSPHSNSDRIPGKNQMKLETLRHFSRPGTPCELPQLTWFFHKSAVDNEASTILANDCE